MENDVLRNKIVPWQEKGRWYHGFVDITTTDFMSDVTDQFIIDNFSILTSGTTLYIRPTAGHYNLVPMDIRTKISGQTNTSSFQRTFTLYHIGGTTATGISVASTSQLTGIVEFWLYIWID